MCSADTLLAERSMIWTTLEVILLVLTSVSAVASFTYGKGLDTWGLISQFCDGNSQSPINFNINEVQNRVNDPPLVLMNGLENPIKVTVKNNGHTVAFFPTYRKSYNLALKGGPLNGTFKFVSLHFHWQSEHTVNNHHFPLELHMVFYNQAYGSLLKASFQPDGLAVLGFFYENSTDAKPKQWIDSLKSVTKIGSRYRFSHPQYMNLKNVIGSTIKPYFHYRGSLTTPPCYETVSWIVQSQPLKISPAQMKLFWNLRGEDGTLGNNYRPLQNLNGREVFLYLKL